MEIRSAAVYETVQQQLRRVLRVTSTSVYYETIGGKRPFYTSCVRTQTFAGDAIREHKVTPVLPSPRRLRREHPPQLGGSCEAGDGDTIEHTVEVE